MGLRLFCMFQLYPCISLRHQSKASEKITGLTSKLCLQDFKPVGAPPRDRQRQCARQLRQMTQSASSKWNNARYIKHEV